MPSVVSLWTARGERRCHHSLPSEPDVRVPEPGITGVSIFSLPCIVWGCRPTAILLAADPTPSEATPPGTQWRSEVWQLHAPSKSGPMTSRSGQGWRSDAQSSTNCFEDAFGENVRMTTVVHCHVGSIIDRLEGGWIARNAGQCYR